MLPTRWILVCLLALSCAACAARVQPRVDAGLGAQWHDGPAVSGGVGLGKYEGALAPLPLMGPVPPLTPEGAPPAPVAAPVPAPDPCADGRCLLAPPADPAPLGAPPVPAPAPNAVGPPGLPTAAWLGIAGAAGGLGLLLARRRATALASATGVPS